MTTDIIGKSMTLFNTTHNDEMHDESKMHKKLTVVQNKLFNHLNQYFLIDILPCLDQVSKGYVYYVLPTFITNVYFSTTLGLGVSSFSYNKLLNSLEKGALLGF